MNCRVLVEAKNLSREQWLEYRKQGIGGSDAGAIAGVNPYKSPMTVYLEKLGLSKDFEDNERMKIGRELEEYVAKRFSEATGFKLKRRNAILYNKKHPFMIANVDRLLLGKNEGLECVVTSNYSSHKWKDDEIPYYYETQCHHYMAVTGAEAWYIAVLIGNEKFVYKRIERDEEIINYLIEIEKNFWENHVLKQEIPQPDGSEDGDRVLNFMYPKSNGEEVVLKDFEEKLYKLKDLKVQIDELEKEKKEIEQNIKAALGDMEVGIIGKTRVTWKSSESSRFDSKRFKRDYPELYSKYINVISSRKFLVR